MKPNFQEMSKKELRKYVLAHRDDNEAFYAYVDKINAEGNRVTHPPLKSLDDIENYPEFLEKLRDNPKPQEQG
ncbi:MAG: phenylacetate--CoA ligase [Microcoleus sp. SU_5_6]|nr:phenylacetate--CoA ligase [Microcoleus sp. SU_5_6]